MTQHSSNTGYATLDLYNPFDNTTTGVRITSYMIKKKETHSIISESEGCVIETSGFAATTPSHYSSQVAQAYNVNHKNSIIFPLFYCKYGK